MTVGVALQFSVHICERGNSVFDQFIVSPLGTQHLPQLFFQKREGLLLSGWKFKNLCHG